MSYAELTDDVFERAYDLALASQPADPGDRLRSISGYLSGRAAAAATPPPTTPPPCWRIADASPYYVPSTVFPRPYQLQIFRSCLSANTLVCLPTGTGKTLIAGLAIANYARWFPSTIVLFVAPTRPLVLQQAKAVTEAIPWIADLSTVLTGKTAAASRGNLWASRHRIFFATPHVPANDMASGILDPRSISMVVIDEAHRATNNYAAARLASTILESNPCVRIVALTATPGSKIAAIQELVTRLAIAQIEFRSEASADLKAVVPGCKIETIVVSPTPQMLQAMQAVADVSRATFDWLRKIGVVRVVSAAKSKAAAPQQMPPGRLEPPPTFAQLEALRETYRKFCTTSREENPVRHAAIESHFALAMTLACGMQRLESYGLSAFEDWFQEVSDRPKHKKVTACMERLLGSPAWEKMAELIRQTAPAIGRCPPNARVPDSLSHPKDEVLAKLLASHFASSQTTRAIVFAQLRSAVYRLVSIASRVPGVVPRALVGSSSSGDGVSVAPADQSAILSDFRTGVFNVLVATSVAEEGIDIGTVDLIVCYDVQASPIRAVQRCGRAGRMRPGRAIMLATAGGEAVQLSRLLARKNAIDRLLKSANKIKFDRGSEEALRHRHSVVLGMQVDDLRGEGKPGTLDLSKVGESSSEDEYCEFFGPCHF